MTNNGENLNYEKTIILLRQITAIVIMNSAEIGYGINKWNVPYIGAIVYKPLKCNLMLCECEHVLK